MSANGTTNIASLPTGEAQQDPIQLVGRDVNNAVGKPPPIYNAKVQPSGLLNQNEIVKVLQKPEVNAMTRFPEQDIQMSTSHQQLDTNQRPEHIPASHSTDYIAEQEIQLPLQRKSDDDDGYDRFRVPLLVSACFFLFQTPIFRRAINNLVPEGRAATGGVTLQNQFLTSVIFGMAIYGCIEIINYIDY